MKTLLAIVLALPATIAIAAKPQEFCVEDTDLQPAPAEVAAAVHPLLDWDDHPCQLVGKPMQLATDGRTPAFVLTTAHACAWGAAKAPIVVVRTGNKPSVVLDSTGYTLRLGPATRHGLLKAKIEAASADWDSLEEWAFNGRKYVQARGAIKMADGTVFRSGRH